MDYRMIVAFSYLIGSIPFGLLIGFLNGVDVRKDGSGNIGSTNVERLCGKFWGRTCFILDVGKGAIPGLIGRSLSYESEWILAFGLAAVIGHCFPIWLKFKGGKGMATSLGMLLSYQPLLAVIGFAIWLIIRRLSRMVSIASVCAAICVTALTPLMRYPATTCWTFFVITLLVTFLHRKNLRRVWDGTEPKIPIREKKGRVDG